MKFSVRKNFFRLLLGLSLVLLHGPAGWAATVDFAALSPAETKLPMGEMRQITFSATNDKAVSLKKYNVKLQFDAGLDLTNLTTTPVADTAKINSKNGSIVLLWQEIPAGTEMKASFDVSCTTVGDYTISARVLKYVDADRNRAAGSCNTATVIARTDFIPPAAPKGIVTRSEGAGGKVSWLPPDDADLSHYKVYRRSAMTSYNETDFFETVLPSYTDLTLPGGETYFYAVRAVDSSGNESLLSDESACAHVFKVLREYDLGVSEVSPQQSAIGDLNGDGKTDLVVSFAGKYAKNSRDQINNRVDIFWGGNISSSPDVTLVPYVMAVPTSSYQQYGFAPLLIDLNSDGYDDLLVMNAKANEVYVYEGGPSFSTTPLFTIVGDNWSTDSYGLPPSIADAGDVNGDGFRDVVMGFPNWDQSHDGGTASSYHIGKIIFLFGGPEIINNTLSIKGPLALKGAYTGTSVAGAGDVNGDGFDDVIVGAPKKIDEINVTRKRISYAALFLGGPVITKAASVFTGEYRLFGRAVAAADYDGDGFSDVAVAGDVLNMYFGGPQWDNVEDEVFGISTNTVEEVGDLNLDGFEDLLYKSKIHFGSNDDGVTLFDIGGYPIGTGDFDKDGRKDFVMAGMDATGGERLTIYSLATVAHEPLIKFVSPRNAFETVYTDTFLARGQVLDATAVLTIDGQTLPLLADGSFEYQLELAEGANVVLLEARNSTGHVVTRTVSVNRFVPSPLALQITVPVAGDVINASSVTVTGTISDKSASVVVNDVVASKIIGTDAVTFYATVPLVDGENTITATATDQYGQTARQSVVVTANSTGKVSGTVSDADTGVPLAGASVTVTDSNQNTFTASTDVGGGYLVEGVAEGTCTVVFAKNGYVTVSGAGMVSIGATTTIDGHLTLLPPLSVAITSPADGVVLRESPLAVTGTVSGTAATVSVNGVSVLVAGNLFQASVALSPGGNTITAIAVDGYGQQQTVSVVVTYAVGGTVSGTITDQLTAEPLEGAVVTVTDSLGVTFSAQTDAAGTFLVSGVAEGPFECVVAKVGYYSATLTDIAVAEGVVTVNIALAPLPPVISNIAVNSVNGNSAVITWQTDRPTDSTVEYGVSMDYDLAVTSPDSTTSHQVVLSGLLSGTVYHFRVAAADGLGTISYSDDGTFETWTLFNIRIDSPTANAIIGCPSVMVRGWFSTAVEGGAVVTVNGIPAMVDGGRFAANHVPLAEGDNLVTVIVSDAEGNQGQASVSVSSQIDNGYLLLHTDAEVDMPPFSTHMQVEETDFVFTGQIQLTAMGAGLVDIVGTDEQGFDVDMSVPGFYYFTAEGRDEARNVITDTIAVLVVDPIALDNELLVKWNGMKDALRAGDNETAASFFSERTQGAYLERFIAFASVVDQVLAELDNATLVLEDLWGGKYAIYDLRVTREGHEQSYQLTFVKGDDNVWQIDRY